LTADRSRRWEAKFGAKIEAGSLSRFTYGLWLHMSASTRLT